MFDMHYAINYLDTKEDRGIVDTLVNQISKKFINHSFFYLPQLWYAYLFYQPYLIYLVLLQHIKNTTRVSRTIFLIDV